MKKIMTSFILGLLIAFTTPHGRPDDLELRGSSRPLADTTITLTITGKDTVKTVSVSRSRSSALERDLYEEQTTVLLRMAKAQEESLFIQKVWLGVTIASFAVTIIMTGLMQ